MVIPDVAEPHLKACGAVWSPLPSSPSLNSARGLWSCFGRQPLVNTLLNELLLVDLFFQQAFCKVPQVNTDFLTKEFDVVFNEVRVPSFARWYVQEKRLEDFKKVLANSKSNSRGSK